MLITREQKIQNTTKRHANNEKKDKKCPHLKAERGRGILGKKKIRWKYNLSFVAVELGEACPVHLHRHDRISSVVSLHTGGIRANNRDVLERSAMADTIKEEACQCGLELAASLEISAEVFVFEDVGLSLDIPDLHATHANTQLAGCGHFALASLRFLLLFISKKTVLTSAHFQIQYTRMYHACCEIFKQDEVCDTSGVFNALDRGVQSRVDIEVRIILKLFRRTSRPGRLGRRSFEVIHCKDVLAITTVALILVILEITPRSIYVGLLSTQTTSRVTTSGRLVGLLTSGTAFDCDFKQIWMVLFDDLVKLVFFTVELFANSLTREAVDSAVTSHLMVVGFQLDSTEWRRLRLSFGCMAVRRRSIVQRALVGRSRSWGNVFFVFLILRKKSVPGLIPRPPPPLLLLVEAVVPDSSKATYDVFLVGAPTRVSIRTCLGWALCRLASSKVANGALLFEGPRMMWWLRISSSKLGGI
ncbi:SAICAR synthase-like protein, partial [Aureobasidium sp. EXF-3399]